MDGAFGNIIFQQIKMSSWTITVNIFQTYHLRMNVKQKIKHLTHTAAKIEVQTEFTLHSEYKFYLLCSALQTAQFACSLKH